MAVPKRPYAEFFCGILSNFSLKNSIHKNEEKAEFFLAELFCGIVTLEFRHKSAEFSFS